MPSSSAKGEGKSKVEGHCHQVEVGHLLQASGALHHHQLVAAPVSGHHADLVGTNLIIFHCERNCQSNNDDDEDDEEGLREASQKKRLFSIGTDANYI